MRLDAKSRLAIALVAAALLVVGLAGPVKRTWQARELEENKRALAEQVARERAQAAERFRADRAEVIAQMRERLTRGEYLDVLRIAAPFGAVDDAELRELYGEAARAESRRQRGEQYAKLVARDCSEALARQALAGVFATVDGVAAPGAPRHLARLAGADATAIVSARLREPPPHEHNLAPAGSGAAPAAVAPTAPRDWIARVRDRHRARILPDYLGFVHSPRASELVCVWRAQGERRDGDRVLAYTLDLWLAPAPDLGGLAPDVARYGEQPR